MPTPEEEQLALDQLQLKKLQAKKYAAHLASQSSAIESPAPDISGSAPPPAPPQEQFSSKEAALQGLGQGASFGYIPELQAAAEPVANFIGNMANLPEIIKGKQPVTTDEDFPTRLARWRAREQAIRQEKPGAYIAGAIPGAITTSAIPGLGAGKGLAGAIKVGAAQGALTNPEVPYSDLAAQLKARAEQGIGGGVLGAAGHAVASAFSAAPAALQGVKESMALDMAGANKTAIKQLLKKSVPIENAAGETVLSKEAVPGIEKFMAKEGLTKPGTTVNDVLADTSKIMKESGEGINALYANAAEKSSAVTDPAKLAKLAPYNINPSALADGFLEEAKAASRGVSGGQKAMATLGSELDDLRGLGDNATLADLVKYRTSLDKNIKYNKTYSESPTSQKLLRDLRTYVQDKINGHIGALDEISGSKDLPLLKALNDRYSKAATIQVMSQDKVAGNKAKMILGIPEILVGQGAQSAAAGALVGGANYSQNRDPMTSAATGLAAALAFKAGRKYGPGIGYGAANLMQKAAVPAANMASKIPINQAGRLTTPWLLMNKGVTK